MSYDIFLYRKDGILKPYKKSEVKERLESKIDASEYYPEVGELAEGFSVYTDLSEGKKNSGFELFFQKEEGCYWTSCSYAVDTGFFTFFKKAIKELAILLDLKIKDPQISEEVFEAADYDADDLRSIKGIETIKELLKPENVSDILGEKVTLVYPLQKDESIPPKNFKKLETIFLPALKKYFIFYVILSKDPVTKEYVYLLKEDNCYVASKVEKGEILKNVIKEQMKEFFNLEKFKLIRVEEEYDFAFDREGNELPRTELTFFVEYFDLLGVKTKFPMKWNKLGK
ncbi:MAG: hypothetical protein WC503_05450 [Candidatus Shapirobacteria bacterium]